MLTTVLVGLAGTEYTESVVETAVNLGAAYEVPLTAITALDIQAIRDVGPVPLGGGQAAKELREQRLQLTQEALDRAISLFEKRCSDLNVEYQVKREQRDSPYDFLASQSRYHDLTVLSLRGILDSDICHPDETDASVTLAKLISGGVRPILAVPQDYRPVKRVFAAYSGSMESAATLRRFMQLCPYRDVEICIATFEMEEERGLRLLKHAAKYCQRYGVKTETLYVPKTASEHLLVEAERWKADLIVLGNSAKNLLLRRVFGETALNTICKSELPLFLSQ